MLIGDQCWMAENLKTTHYRDGTPIDHVTDVTGWVGLEATETGAYCAFDNDPSNIATYGLLYNGYAVDDPHGLAPEGWHIPTDEEWQVLEIYLGMDPLDAAASDWRGTNEGSKMAGGYDLWLGHNLRNDAAFGESGLDLLPAGYRGRTGWFSYMSINSYCWSSSSYSTPSAWTHGLAYSTSDVARYYISKRDGFSIRCVRD